MSSFQGFQSGINNRFLDSRSRYESFSKRWCGYGSFYLLIRLFIPGLAFQHVPHNPYLANKMCRNNEI